MNTYEVRYQTKSGHYDTCEVIAVDYARAMIGWRHLYPGATMVWAKLKAAKAPDPRLPREED